MRIPGVLDEITGKIRRQLTEMDENYNLLIKGIPGKGKSGSAIEIGRRIDKKFTVDHIVFSPLQLIELVQSKPKNYWRGRVIIFDEAGVGRNAYKARSKANTALNEFFQTWRYLNICTIFTASFRSFIVKNDRKLMHAEIKIDQKFKYPRKEVKARFYYLQYNERRDEIYTKNHRTIWNGLHLRVKYIYIPHPPMDLWKAYQKRVDKFKKSVMQESKEKLMPMIENEVDKRERLIQYQKEQLEESQRELRELYKKFKKIVRKDPSRFIYQNRIPTTRIEVALGVSEDTARKIMAMSDVEGFTVKMVERERKKREREIERRKAKMLEKLKKLHEKKLRGEL